MCVPPCEAGVKPMPPMPASRPRVHEHERDQPDDEQDLGDGQELVTTPRKGSQRSRDLHAFPSAQSVPLDDRLDQLRGDPVLRHVAGAPRPGAPGRRRCASSEPVSIRMRRPVVLGTDRLRRLDAVHHGHGDVHQHDVGPPPRRRRDGLLAVGCATRRARCGVAGEDRLQRLGEEPMVVRDQHADGTAMVPTLCVAHETSAL